MNRPAPCRCGHAAARHHPDYGCLYLANASCACDFFPQRALRVPPIFWIFCAALLGWGVWACALIHARTNPLKIGRSSTRPL